jgi:myo-inositol 2-dehydrogenase / D-chiro-inositol 1-dehydrogenase
MAAAPAGPGDPVRLAFAGAGWMAAVHGDAIAQVPDATITAVASRDPARAAESAQQLGAVACAYDDLPAGADAVIVCTPPAVHAQQALVAMAAGAAVLVEKPLCGTLDEADALVEAAKAGGRLAYAENLVYAPVVGLALEHAAQLGEADLLEVRALQARPGWGDFLTEAWGGGVLFDLGVHPVAVALLLAAPARPVEVRAVLQGSDQHPVDEHADVSIAFDTGLVAHVVCSWQEAERDVTWDAQLSSPAGVVRFELLPEVRLERNGVDVALPRPPEGAAPLLAQLGYLQQMETFVDDVATGRQPELGPAFGRSVLDLVCAAYWSAGRAGAWVELPFAGPRDRTPIQLWRGG